MALKDRDYYGIELHVYAADTLKHILWKLNEIKYN